uniref:Tumor protein p53-inducible protein 11 n=1 Tax=Ficedula albicollis TaxID=59894 RepID=A0A803VWX7_FICAL
MGSVTSKLMLGPLSLLSCRVWQLVSAVMFSGVAIMALAFPDQLFDAIFEEEAVSSKTPIRLYGGALLSECRTADWGTLLPRRARGQGAAGTKSDTCSWRAEHLPLAKKLLKGKLGYC